VPGRVSRVHRDVGKGSVERQSRVSESRHLRSIIGGQSWTIAAMQGQSTGQGLVSWMQQRHAQPSFDLRRADCLAGPGCGGGAAANGQHAAFARMHRLAERAPFGAPPS